MGHSRILVGLLALACNAFEDKPPPVPEGYPKIGEYESGKAELKIDGENYVSESGGGTDFNVEGGFEDELDADTDFYPLSLSYRDIEVGTYTVASGDLIASYNSHVADRVCGDGRMEIVGVRSWDSGILGEREFMWGTIQLQLCPEYPDEGDPPFIEISGRFSSIISRS